jgi:hypothetical protein
MEDNGYPVQVQDTLDLSEINSEHRVPPELQSCHTAIVDGYVITGHVPIAEVERLLTERPDITGLAVPGMPIGSPGMEMAGVASEPFDVIAFDGSGATEVYASYNP